MSSAGHAGIAFDHTILRDQEAVLQREWLATNGLGAYASATLAGANTRRYHGLLVAALNPPLGRAVLLSHFEENLDVVGADGIKTSCALSTNLYPGVVHPQGFRLLESWTDTPVATWIWSPTPGVRIEKRVWMARGRNTTYVSYRLLEAPRGASAHLHLTPLLAWKDYHSEMHAGGQVVNAAWFGPTAQDGANSGAANASLRVTLPGIWRVTTGPFTLSLQVVDANGAPYLPAAYRSEPGWYYRFQHPREMERGQDFEEDLYTPGTLELPLSVGRPVVVIASVEDHVDSPEAALAEIENHRSELTAKAALTDDFGRTLTLAADAFLVQVPGARSTIIAGYPWFADWGRDTMIALPGLCLSTGRAEIAREILLSFAAYVDQGMLPNRFPDVGETPEYNTVDATLWYFNAIYGYVSATGDEGTLANSFWKVLEGIVEYHRKGTRFQIHVDPADNLLYAGEPDVQLTWMDAKIGDWVVTPRIGKPVEINALWHNALRIMADFAARLKDAEAAARYDALARQTAESFAARFPRADGQGFYDVLDAPGGQPDLSVRPNQVFAVSLPFPPVDPKSPAAKTIIDVVERDLLTPVGLRSLSPNDPGYRATYGGNQWSRDSGYHQGTVWGWLLGPFVEAHYRVYQDRERARELLLGIRSHLTDYGVGSIAEIFDGDAPFRPNGCVAQAWSVSETLRVWKLLQKES